MSLNIYNEFEIIQNDLVGVHALHEFIRSFTENNKGTGPKIYWLFPVLPILFNEESTELIYSRNFNQGSFAKVINEKNDLFITLQKRMEEFSPKTFNCIYIASNSRLFSYDTGTARVFLLRDNSIAANLKGLGNDYQKIILAAKRLGTWFSKMSEDELLIYLNIKF